MQESMDYNEYHDWPEESERKNSLVIICGGIGSGKTSLAEKLKQSDSGNAIILSYDDISNRLFGENGILKDLKEESMIATRKENASIIQRYADAIIKKAREEKKDLIIDTAALTQNKRNNLRKRAGKFDRTFCVFMNESFDTEKCFKHRKDDEEKNPWKDKLNFTTVDKCLDKLEHPNTWEDFDLILTNDSFIKDGELHFEHETFDDLNRWFEMEEDRISEMEEIRALKHEAFDAYNEFGEIFSEPGLAPPFELLDRHSEIEAAYDKFLGKDRDRFFLRHSEEIEGLEGIIRDSKELAGEFREYIEKEREKWKDWDDEPDWNNSQEWLSHR